MSRLRSVLPRLCLPAAMVIAALEVSACVLSLQPLYREKDLVFEPKLVGVWKAEDSSVTWECRRDGETSYRVVFTDEKGRKGVFSGRLLEVGGERFIDLFPVTSELEGNAFFLDHFVPAHTFAHLLSLEPELRFAVLDEGWFEKRLAADPGLLRHESRGDRVLITASPEEMQRVFLANLTSEGAFRSTGPLRRSR